MKLILTIIASFLVLFALPRAVQADTTFWKFQSIDTMKYSRDAAREKLGDQSFDAVIDQQMKEIAETGATHVAVGTPYDGEFLPILKRWVTAARRYNLHVWFRGNWSGWEGWFGYKSISRMQHTEMTKQFILKNPDLFEDGDAFSSCPECENGGPGDPRKINDVYDHRVFLIDEYRTARDAFTKINRNMMVFNSMNGDVARLIMDRGTTKDVGGIVVIDHYVPTPEKTVADIKKIADYTGGKVILGEVGVPIPDIHGQMSEFARAVWIQNLFTELLKVPEFIGANYWVSVGGSTELWNEKGVESEAAKMLRTIYKPSVITGNISATFGWPIEKALISFSDSTIYTNAKGEFSFPYFTIPQKLHVSADGYRSQDVLINSPEQRIVVNLVPQKTSILFIINHYLQALLGIFR